MVGTPGVDTRIMLAWGVNESQRKWRNLPMTPDCFLDPNRGSGKWLCSAGVSGIGQCGQTRSTPSGGYVKWQEHTRDISETPSSPRKTRTENVFIGNKSRYGGS